MKINIIYKLAFLVVLAFSSCKSIKDNKSNFSDNDAVIYFQKNSNGEISEVEIEVKLDKRAEGAEKTEDFHAICLGFGKFNDDSTYFTKGQQAFIPSKNIFVSFNGKSVLKDIVFKKEGYLYLKLDISSLNLDVIDKFYVWFTLIDETRIPRLRYNTDAFFYRSEKGKQFQHLLSK